MELVQQLVSGLGIQEDQAKGGAGLLFQLAKDKLSGGEFDQIAAHVPEMGDLLSAAPAADNGGGGLGGALGGIASALGGSAGGLGSLASLAGGFSQLGLDAGMIGQLAPIVISFVQGKGGDQVSGLLQGVLSGD
ncbi:DUF2780 domain-containing protein [Candidatus Entotheonella palauensis]|uniref:DUF2780 domain-containing protein n=1 Tax=Candidatus Entotheonella gemina TaxID=1429439 RepID=W4MG46_9BACT|nr:DUF2780 domain-containing protein [Candidatus Entotheonella palauensis]ETX09165.1 MAG: hypothetical protein ETSY2_01125 [Candidatus Entotheonella gemina]